MSRHLLADTLVINKQYEGPPGWANGGYLAGVMARAIGDPVTVRYLAPVPVETELEFHSEGDRAVIRQIGGETLVAAERSEPPQAPVDPVTPAVAREAAAALTGEGHPFPRCWVCGPLRGVGDGLRILPGPVDGSGVVATTWIPSGSTNDLWSALDCPSGFAAAWPGRSLPIVLGTITASVVRKVPDGVELVVVAGRGHREGRKRFGSSAIYFENEVVAWADSIWIEI